MSKHTPGPWRLFAKEERHNFIEVAHCRRDIPGASSLIVALVTVRPSWNEEQTANARLIAAAPDLLEALRNARTFIKNGVDLGYIRMPDADCPDSAHNTLPAIEAALAKAQGDEDGTR